jgi:hypothetical protein
MAWKATALPTELFPRRRSGQGRIRTFEAFPQRVYSPSHLTTLVPARLSWFIGRCLSSLASEGNRTPDPLITNQPLYQLSYAGAKNLSGNAKRYTTTGASFRKKSRFPDFFLCVEEKRIRSGTSYPIRRERFCQEKKIAFFRISGHPGPAGPKGGNGRVRRRLKTALIFGKLRRK